MNTESLNEEVLNLKKEKLIRISADLFLKKGIDSVRMVDIAEAAGIGVAEHEGRADGAGCEGAEGGQAERNMAQTCAKRGTVSRFRRRHACPLRHLRPKRQTLATYR